VFICEIRGFNCSFQDEWFSPGHEPDEKLSLPEITSMDRLAPVVL